MQRVWRVLGYISLLLLVHGGVMGALLGIKSVIKTDPYDYNTHEFNGGLGAACLVAAWLLWRALNPAHPMNHDDEQYR